MKFRMSCCRLLLVCCYAFLRLCDIKPRAPIDPAAKIYYACAVENSTIGAAQRGLAGRGRYSIQMMMMMSFEKLDMFL